MKLTTLIAAITGLALAATAQAGEEASAKQVIAPIAALCDWSWFAGGSVGVIDGDDWDEDIYTLHIGKERKCAGDKCSQAIYLEVGFTESDLNESAVERGAPQEGPEQSFVTNSNTDIEIIPITLNYKYECELSDKLNWYAGAGAGIALVDADIRELYSGVSVVIFRRRWIPPRLQNLTMIPRFTAIFLPALFTMSATHSRFLAARALILMDDVLGGDSPLDEEVHYELGARYNF